MSALLKYNAAITAFETKKTFARHMAAFLDKVGTAFRDVGKVRLGNTGEVGFAGFGALDERAPMIDMNLWPTRETVIQTMYEYHEAKSALKNAYHSLSISEKNLVPPPETYH